MTTPTARSGHGANPPNGANGPCPQIFPGWAAIMTRMTYGEKGRRMVRIQQDPTNLSCVRGAGVGGLTMGISSTGFAAASLGVRKRVLIVDDQRTFADLLELALSASADLDCEGVASGPEEAIALVRRRPPDLVIMDLHFATSTLDGVDATAEIKRTSPSTQVVVLTGHADRTVLRRAAEAGACSLIPKDGSLPELMGAIRSAAPGAMVVHPRLLRALLAERAEAPEQPRLSRRELDIVGMLSLGMDTRTISEHLGISL